MKEKVLIITEGKKPENKIMQYLASHKLVDCKTEYEFIFVIWNANIISLCNEVISDEFLDYFSVLKCKSNFDYLNNYSIEEISQIFLFFDFDIQATKHHEKESYLNTIKRCLNVCCDELSQYGKLFISFPMIEAFWDCYQDECSDRTCFYSIEDSEKYKTLISKRHPQIANKINESVWLTNSSFNLTKTIQFMKTNFEIDSILDISDLEILEKEIKLLELSDKFLSLSPIPRFVISLYGNKFLNMLDTENQFCSFSCIK